MTTMSEVEEDVQEKTNTNGNVMKQKWSIHSVEAAHRPTSSCRSLICLLSFGRPSVVGNGGQPATPPLDYFYSIGEKRLA